MRKISFYILLCAIISFSGCSKNDDINPDQEIIGNWSITKIEWSGTGPVPGNLSVPGGDFWFKQGGSLTYTAPDNTVYAGTWNMDHLNVGGEEKLRIDFTVSDASNQTTILGVFDDVYFVNSHYFKGTINEGSNLFTYHFRR